MMWERGRQTQSKHNCEEIITGNTTMWERGQSTQLKHNCGRIMISNGIADQCRHHCDMTII